MSERQRDPITAPAGAVPAQEGPATGPAMSPETASLLGLIDRLGALLERSDVVELDVEAGETGIVLRKPVALAPAAAPAATPVAGAGDAASGKGDAAGGGNAADPVAAPAAKSVKAPLTGIFYSASSPTSPPYVTVGQHVTVGQVIGLIEAMKLFNEIKSDQAGRVVRIVAETGKLVKAKQPLIEVEP
jgi:acetyl-CoA carboxylase biotin carboxyl carrier protein